MLSSGENTELNGEKERSPRSAESEGNCCPSVKRKLIPAKLFYFFYFSSLGSLLPYLALYFKQLKLTPTQVGILMGLKPFVEFICTPLWGAVVDRFKMGKLVLLMSLLVAALSQFSLSLVAPAERLCTLNTISRSRVETIHLILPQSMGTHLVTGGILFLCLPFWMTFLGL